MRGTKKAKTVPTFQSEAEERAFILQLEATPFLTTWFPLIRMSQTMEMLLEDQTN